jgi:hypothetical protein
MGAASKGGAGLSATHASCPTLPLAGRSSGSFGTLSQAEAMLQPEVAADLQFVNGFPSGGLPPLGAQRASCPGYRAKPRGACAMTALGPGCGGGMRTGMGLQQPGLAPPQPPPQAQAQATEPLGFTLGADEAARVLAHMEGIAHASGAKVSMTVDASGPRLVLDGPPAGISAACNMLHLLL